MSEHSKILEKYEKMFEDGSAYKPIRLTQPNPSVGEVTGSREPEPSNVPLGEEVNRDVFMEDNQPDYSQFDATMKNRIKDLKEANIDPNTNTSNVNVQNNVIEKLVRRVELLEKALGLVMETQTKLLKEGR